MQGIRATTDAPSRPSATLRVFFHFPYLPTKSVDDIDKKPSMNRKILSETNARRREFKRLKIKKRGKLRRNNQEKNVAMKMLKINGVKQQKRVSALTPFQPA